MAAAWNKGRKMSDESRAKMSQVQKGRPHPWNKGVKAWNYGLKWPEEVKENISKGMIAYWMQRKQQIKKTY